MRIGIGYDIHRLSEGRKLVIGGVEIDHERGLLGHSDADVLAHAICDALLGASGQGDIGKHFPDTDERYRGISSLALLEKIAHLLRKRRYAIVNVDATVVLEAPRLACHLDGMKRALARAMAVSPGCVNLKAATNEGLDAVGRGEAIAAWAVALIEKP